MIELRISLLVLVILVAVSFIAGRVSLYTRKYTGWYDRYIDVSELVYLIENAALFFSSILFSLLLVVTGTKLQYDIIVLGIITLLYIIIVIAFQVGKKRQKKGGRRFRSWFSLLSTWFKRKPDSTKPNSESSSHPGFDQDSGTRKPTPKSLLLRFISVFSLTLFICIFLFFVLLLFVNNANGTGAQVESFYSLFREWRSIEWDIILDCHFEFLLPTFLLTLTSVTGVLIAGTSIDYGRELDSSELTEDQRILKDLMKSIENR